MPKKYKSVVKKLKGKSGKKSKIDSSPSPLTVITDIPMGKVELSETQAISVALIRNEFADKILGGIFMLSAQNSFGQRVKELRLASGMTQGQLGEAVGITKQGIQAIESGRRDTTLPRIISLADFFDVDANYLLGRVQTPDSMVIEELAYDNGVLFVHFRNNDWYSYSNVPKDVYENFSAAQSKGQFFLKNIMPEYPCSICEAPPFQQISP